MLNNMIQQFSRAWKDLWFQEQDTLPLEVVRFGLGFLLFYNYILFPPEDLLALYGPNGLISRDLVELTHWQQFSIFAFLDEPWQFLSIHYFFVTCCFCLWIGWRANWVKWLVLIGHLSYFNRNEFAFYGVDSVAIALLFLICIAPVGKTLSWDRIRQVRRYKDKNGLDERPPLDRSTISFACLRLMQFQMAVIFFSAGIEKLYGSSWWSGDGPWFAMVNNETAFFPLGLFAEHYWIINLIAFGTILVELAYPFLIWGKKSRPYILAAALTLHLGIAIFLGMVYFASLMAMGHLVFMRREWYAAIGRWWQKRFSGIEMIYDGDCGFCKRSMCLFLAFDGLQQIRTRDYHTNPSPKVPSEMVAQALYTITAKDKAIPGFDAYRHVVLRVPGMFFLVPFFYVPVFSKLIGRLIYKWVAKNRMMLSRVLFKARPPGKEARLVAKSDSDIRKAG